MNKFPESLKNIDEFENTLKDLFLNKLRKQIYIHILRNNQNDFFDIELFNRKYVKDMKKMDEYIEFLIKELEKVGWKTFIGYGGTGLFFYDKEIPKNAW